MLKQKIAKTHLFAEYEKVEILSQLDEYSEQDKKTLEGVLDEYDGKYKEVMSSFRSRMLEELDGIVKKSPTNPNIGKATETIKQGILSLTTETS